MLNAETVVPKPQEAGTREYNAPPLSTMIPLTWVNNVNFFLWGKIKNFGFYDGKFGYFSLKRSSIFLVNLVLGKIWYRYFPAKLVNNITALL